MCPAVRSMESHGQIQNLNFDWWDQFSYFVKQSFFPLLHSFNIRFNTAKEEGDDIAFYLRIYPEYASNQSVYTDGKVDNQEWILGCPLLKGSAFDIFIVIGNESYVVMNKQINNTFTAIT